MPLNFWNDWSRPTRLTYGFSLGFLLLSSLVFVVAWARGTANAIRWDVLSELNEVPVAIHTFTDGLLDYVVRGRAYAVTGQFVASPVHVQPGVATAFLVGIGLAFVLILSAVTRFDRLRYLISMGLLIVGLAFFRWDMLDVPGFGNRNLFLLLTFAFGSLSYYFHAFRSDLPITVRLGAFGLLTGAVALLIGTLSPVSLPAMTVVSYGLPVLLLLSVGFLFFIGAEIIASLVWLTTIARADGSAPGRTLGMNNFLFISALYLLNLVLIWLRNTRSIDWDVLAVSPFVVYLASVTLGIWGFRRLIEQQRVMSFRDGGAYLYVGLATLTTLTMAYAFATANDPLVEVFEDAIVYSHLAMGVVFVAYVLINFWPIFRANRPIYRVLYNPKRLELSLFRVVAVFILAALLASGGLITLKQAIAGYYNGLGDLYVASGERQSAGAFYGRALEAEFQNHKSNYALASLARQQDDWVNAALYYERAMLKQPQPHDYAGLSQTYQQTGLFFEAVKALQRGLRAFPNNGELQNNLGYLYARTNVADSTYYYLKTAADNAGQPDVAETNLLAFYARHPAVLSADSTLAQHLDRSTDDAYQANALALRLIAGTDTTQPQRPNWLTDKPTNEGLSVGRFASVYNYALANARPDTTVATTLRRLSENPLNQDFTDDLLLARAIAEYNDHNHAMAFGLLNQLAEGDNQDGATYRQAAGLLMLEQGLYRPAAEQFAQNTDTLSTYYRALALTKAGDPVLAQSLWETAARGDSTVAVLKQVLYNERKPQTDLEKAFYVTYRTDDLNRGAYWETIGDPNLKTVAGVALANAYLDDLQWRNDQLMLSNLPDAKTLGPVALSLRNVAAVRLSAFRRSVGSAATLVKQPILPTYEADRTYWLGQTYERVGWTGKALSTYRRVLRLAPLRADAVAATAGLLRTRPAYDLVRSALPFNEANADLLKLYITLCVDQSLFDYAEAALPKLQAVAQPADYQAFQSAYQQRLALIEKNREKFAQ